MQNLNGDDSQPVSGTRRGQGPGFRDWKAAEAGRGPGEPSGGTLPPPAADVVIIVTGTARHHDGNGFFFSW